MTFTEIMAKIDDDLMVIECEATDNEAAHSYEDAMMRFALGAIASGKLDASECAKVAGKALESRNIQFIRWYA